MPRSTNLHLGSGHHVSAWLGWAWFETPQAREGPCATGWRPTCCWRWHHFVRRARHVETFDDRKELRARSKEGCHSPENQDQCARKSLQNVGALARNVSGRSLKSRPRASGVKVDDTGGRPVVVRRGPKGTSRTGGEDARALCSAETASVSWEKTLAPRTPNFHFLLPSPPPELGDGDRDHDRPTEGGQERRDIPSGSGLFIFRLLTKPWMLFRLPANLAPSLERRRSLGCRMRRAQSSSPPSPSGPRRH